MRRRRCMLVGVAVGMLGRNGPSDLVEFRLRGPSRWYAIGVPSGVFRGSLVEKLVGVWQCFVRVRDRVGIPADTFLLYCLEIATEYATVSVISPFARLSAARSLASYGLPLQ